MQADELLDENQYNRLAEYVNQCEINQADADLHHNAWPTCTTINLPLAIIHQIGSVLVYRYRREELHMVQLLQLDEQVRGLMESAVTAEKLSDTAIPTAYTRHISRLLTVWLTGLPMVIWPMTGFATPAVCLACGYFILGFEDVATQMENPFYVLPQVEYCMQSNNTCHSVLKLSLADTVVRQEGELLSAALDLK